MGTFSNLNLRRLHSRLGDVVYQMTKLHHTSFSPPQAWRPAVNIYRCDSLIGICVDIAGVDKKSIDVRAEPRRLLLTGRREAPDPIACGQKAKRVLAMEIDYGPFQREFLFDEEVEVTGVKANQDNGLLWVTVPLAAQA